VRKNTEQVIRAWEHDRPERSSASIWTDGHNIWSYQTPIAVEVLKENGEIGLVMNVTRYSPTTSEQQSAIRAELASYIVRTVDGMPRGDTFIEVARSGKCAPAGGWCGVPGCACGGREGNGNGQRKGEVS